jgi:prepilin-type N-terminal cleavage/methylation domain-containing protein
MIKVRGGFTLVELMITMVIMVILTTIAVAATSSIQAHARDNERERDVQAIARGLEQRYNQNNPKILYFTTKKMYPGIEEFFHIEGDEDQSGWFYPSLISGGYRTEAYPGTSESNFLNPSQVYAWKAYCTGDCYPRSGQTAKQREIELVQEAFTDGSSYSDYYVYAPLTSDGNPCYSVIYEVCQKFNLYWRTETDTTPMHGIPGLKVIKSKHQQ